MSREEVHELVGERARELLDLSGNCAQSAFAALQEHFNLDGENILKALTPFPGLALRGEACGAVVGSLMALGLVYGRDDLTDKKRYVASLPSARRFCTEFEKKYSSTSCTDILEENMGRKFNLADSIESKEYLLAGGQKVCGEVVENAVQIASALIRRKRK